MKAKRNNNALYANDQWQVTGDHLGCVSEGYWIDVNRLGETRQGTDLPDWPIHLAEKNWVNACDFMDAFRFALESSRGRYEGGFTDDQLDLAEVKMIRGRALGDAYDIAVRRWQERVPGGGNLYFFSMDEWQQFDKVWSGKKA